MRSKPPILRRRPPALNNGLRTGMDLMVARYHPGRAGLADGPRGRVGKRRGGDADELPGPPSDIIVRWVVVLSAGPERSDAGHPLRTAPRDRARPGMGPAPGRRRSADAGMFWILRRQRVRPGAADGFCRQRLERDGGRTIEIHSLAGEHYQRRPHDIHTGDLIMLTKGINQLAGAGHAGPPASRSSSTSAIRST